jgi:transcriptional regulator with XRE-family HTH domain
MDVNSRIRQFLKKMKITVQTFESSIGKTNGYIAHTKSPTAGVLAEIAKVYPDLNLDWLITGEGEMLKNSGANENNTSFINVDDDLNTIEMEKKIKRLEASIDALIEKNERLEAQLAEYKAKEVIRKGTA